MSGMGNCGTAVRLDGDAEWAAALGAEAWPYTRCVDDLEAATGALLLFGRVRKLDAEALGKWRRRALALAKKMIMLLQGAAVSSPEAVRSACKLKRVLEKTALYTMFCDTLVEGTTRTLFGEMVYALKNPNGLITFFALVSLLLPPAYTPLLAPPAYTPEAPSEAHLQLMLAPAYSAAGEGPEAGAPPACCG